MKIHDLIRRIRDDHHGFIDPNDLGLLAHLDRRRQVLIRWHEGRCLVAADTCAELILATERGGWCLRDVCLPTTDRAYTHPAEYPRRRPAGLPGRFYFREECIGGAIDAAGGVVSDAEGGL